MTNTNTENLSWHEIRRQSITGTDIAKILGVSKYATALDLYYDKVNGNELDDNAAMWFGRRLEPIVAERFTLETEIEHLPALDNIKHDTLPYFVANPDYFCLDGDAEGVLEIKTTRSRKEEVWGQEYTDQVPDEYLCQVAWYCYVCDLDFAYIAVLFSGQTLGVYKYKRDKDFEAKIVRAAYDFYHKHLKPKVPPEVRHDSLDYEYKAYEPREGEKVVSNDSEVIKMAEEYQKIANEIKELTKRKEELKQQLTDEFDSFEVLRNNIGEKIASLKTIYSEVIDKAGIKENHPDVYEKYFSKEASKQPRLDVWLNRGK